MAAARDAIEGYMILELVEVPFQQFLPQFVRQVGFGVVEEGRDVVLQRSPASTLIVDEPGILSPHHHVSGLEVAIQEELAGCLEEEFGQRLEVALEPGLMEGN